MKCIIFFLSVQLLVTSAKSTDRIFIGSTPAAPIVRQFLAIPLADSIDFIRWKIILHPNSYELNCNYGIGKPNTNGFLEGGKKIELKGTLRKEASFFQLVNAGKFLMLTNLNDDLIHVLDNNKKLLVGNGGWSYTLNNITPKHLTSITTVPSADISRDSMVFDGRTPCGVPGIVEEGKLCYKLKWRIVFYPSENKNQSGKCKILATGMRPNGKIANWNIVHRNDREAFYELSDENKKPFIHLLKVDENILVFTDGDGKLLVGNEDFSYTLNRIK